MATDYQKLVKARVVKIDSKKTWDFFITQANNQGYLVVVHFTAAWCMPSVAMNRFFEKQALTYKNIMFLSVDVDDNKDVASSMGIKAMPTFLWLRQGHQVDKLVGANPDEIKKRINTFI